MGDFFWTSGTILSELRVTEKLVEFYTNPLTNENSISVHDLRAFTRIGAIMGIVTTLVVCVVLATGSLLLSKITQDLVLTPIEEMINKVKDITRNPIEAAQ